MNSSLRSVAIAEWRGLPEKKTRADRWQSPADLVPKLMQRLGLRERLHETEVIEAWSKIVGDFIAAHSAPVALRDGILYVRVLQPALHYELEQISKSEILRKLKQRFGGKDRKSTRLNSSHSQISYAVFCLKKKQLTYTYVESTSTNRSTSVLCTPIINCTINTSSYPHSSLQQTSY